MAAKTKYAICGKGELTPRGARFDTAQAAFDSVHVTNRSYFDIVRVEVTETYFKQEQKISWVDA